MPETAKSKKSETNDAELPFEEALGRLEQLVQGMESDKIPLDKLIENYEQGTSLYQVCAKRLEEARGRIERIRRKRSGAVELEEIEPPANETPTSNVTSKADSPSDAE